MPRLLLRIVSIALLVAALAAASLAWYASRPLAFAGERADFTIARGSAMRAAAEAIAASGVELRPELFYWLARLTGHASRIKAGSYEIRRGITAWELVLKLSAGDVSQGELRLNEGWSFAQMRAAVEAHPDLEHQEPRLSDREILARIGATESHPEGLFFPDTYLFDRRSSDLDLYRRAYAEMKARLAAAWEKRVPGLPLATPYEALTLASIIEKETGRPEDRSVVASVFINRLRIGMRLQTDPTVIYGLGEAFDGNLRRRDLEQDTPYNTYTRAGLPPTPIALPGLAAIEAALNPAETEWFYFVARGDGSSAFSRTLTEHNRAVTEFQLRRK